MTHPADRLAEIKAALELGLDFATAEQTQAINFYGHYPKDGLGRKVESAARDVDLFKSAIASLAKQQATPEAELPGMWERADFTGGATDVPQVPAAQSGGEPAPPNNLPDWNECALRVANSDFIAKRVAEGGYGPEHDSKLATELHRFIHEYDDSDPYRSAWFLHRLEKLLQEVATPLHQPAPPPPPQEPTVAQAVPEGWKLVLVNERFEDLMYWLDRCESKGHLENCSDLIEPWAAFDYRPAHPQVIDKVDAEGGGNHA